MPGWSGPGCGPTAPPALRWTRAATIGKDLLFVVDPAAGGIRIRRVEARKSLQIVDSVLVRPPGAGAGEPPVVRYALNAYGLATAELVARSPTTSRDRTTNWWPSFGALATRSCPSRSS